MKKIITISREFGAGGGEIGRRVAENLKFEYFDKALILDAAKEVNADVEKVVESDEKAPFLAGFSKALFDFYNKPLNEKLFDAQRNVIRKIAEHGSCVIVGRNANAILREFDNALHVFIHADEYWRMNRLKKEKMQDVSESKILQDIANVDKIRRKYCAYFTATDFGVARYYDVCLDSSTLGIDACVDMICNLARA